jgi:hypothetical protein
MRAMRAAVLAIAMIALYAATASATSVLATEANSPGPYYAGTGQMISSLVSIGSLRCTVVRMTGRVTAGSSSTNSTINPFITSGFERCEGAIIFGNNVNNWVATFNVTNLTVTVSNWEIIEEETFARCIYRGTLNGSYTNPIPPAHAKIAFREQSVPKQTGSSFICASSRLVTGTFDFTGIEPVADLWLVSR